MDAVTFFCASSLAISKPNSPLEISMFTSVSSALISLVGKLATSAKLLLIRCNEKANAKAKKTPANAGHHFLIALFNLNT